MGKINSDTNISSPETMKKLIGFPNWAISDGVDQIKRWELVAKWIIIWDYTHLLK